ncbi:hypothetical protein D9M72_468150 [compost metagenome]
MSSLNFSISCLPRWPRAPSAKMVYLACNSMPSWKFSVGSPSLLMPILPVATPLTEPSSLKSTSAAGKPGKISTPSASACWPSQRTKFDRLMM